MEKCLTADYGKNAACIIFSRRQVRLLCLRYLLATNIDSFGTLIAILSRLHAISREPERISDYFHSQKVPHVTIYATLSDLYDGLICKIS